MTPQEKAKELINKQIDSFHSKQLAWIEVVDTIENIKLMPKQLIEDPVMNNKLIVYLEEVLDEIEKL